MRKDEKISAFKQAGDPPDGTYRWTLDLIVEEAQKRELVCHMKNIITWKKIVLVMDNLATHKEKHLIDLYGETEGKKLWNKFEVHYTPKHGSWLNQAEIAIGMYSRQCLGNGGIGTLENLKIQTKAWNKRANQKKIKINWRFTKSKARKSLQYNSK